MEAIKALPSNEIPAILQPCHEIFYPLLEANRAKIESVPKKTFTYGTIDRHKLDIYYPTVGAGNAPVLLFAYGGGFVSGERTVPQAELQHGNIGAFFASRGIATVIADYRLAPGAQYPGAAEDLKDAVAWLIGNADVVNQGASIQLDLKRFFLMGHSAGAAHVATVMLAPGLLPPTIKPLIRGVILLGTAYHFRKADPYSMTIVHQYYGEDEKAIREHEPLGLFESASEELLKSLPGLLVLRSEREPSAIQAVHDDFSEFAKNKPVLSAETGVIEGHNHISMIIALSTGEGEEWGERVVSWVNARA